MESLLVTAAALLSWGRRWPSFIFTHEDLWLAVSAVAAGMVYLLVIMLSKCKKMQFQIKKENHFVQPGSKQTTHHQSCQWNFQLFGLIIKYWLIFTVGVNNTQHQQ